MRSLHARKFRARCLLALVLVLAARLLAAGGGEGRSYYSYHPFPQCVLLASRPEIVWPVWGDQGMNITSQQIWLAGERLATTYDTTRRYVVARPRTPLPPGEYKVECKVTFNSRYEVTKQWRFQVHKTAQETFIGPDASQNGAIDMVNRLRADAGLQALASDNRLHRTANRQANYIDVKGALLHQQAPGTPGFFGQTPSDRANTYGWPGPCSEALARTQTTVADAALELYHAPYHRRLFMQPGPLSIGVGKSGYYSVILFGGIPNPGVVVTPPDGSSGVPCSWDGVETPTPLRIPGYTAPVGYPIMLSCFGDDAKGMRFVSAEMTGQKGKQIEIAALHPGNDDHSDESVILLPRKPLHPRTTYRVRVTVEYSSGQLIERLWAFTTGDH